MKKKSKIPTKKDFQDLAECLFDMELEAIGRDTDFHFQWNNWYEKFGQSSVVFEPLLVKKDEDVEELAAKLEEDFNKGEFEADENGCMYEIDMPTIYAGFITDKLELQLAEMTRVGTQLELELS